MNPADHGYLVETTLARSAHSTVHRARSADGLPVILKALDDAQATPERVAWLRREHDICRDLALDGVMRPLDLVVRSTGAMLVSEDIGGIALADWLRDGPLPLLKALRVAVQLARSLGQVHARGVTHGDLAPGNVVVVPQTEQVRIIDFGHASRLRTERPGFADATERHGTLAYISPEQTGRMNRAVDARSDLYALGATLFHMLTGRPPAIGCIID